MNENLIKELQDLKAEIAEKTKATEQLLQRNQDMKEDFLNKADAIIQPVLNDLAKILGIEYRIEFGDKNQYEIVSRELYGVFFNSDKFGSHYELTRFASSYAMGSVNDIRKLALIVDIFKTHKDEILEKGYLQAIEQAQSQLNKTNLQYDEALAESNGCIACNNGLIPFAQTNETKSYESDEELSME